jgi:hypothetical protein
MIEPGKASGTLLAFAEGDAIGGSEGAIPSLKSLGDSSAGVAVGVGFAPGLFGVGEGSGFFSSSGA